MAAGSIIVDLLMRTGQFSTDTDRAAKRLKAFQRDVETAGKVMGAALAAGAVAAAVGIDALIKSVGDFKDIEEIAGGSAESFASLTIAAAGAGVSMDSIVASSIRLTKGLTGVDDESKAAGAALKALGINVVDFKKLDPVSQYEAVGQALGKYADGAEKTAVAVALFGKAGAEQLKVFKALEETGGRQVVLTQQQIEAADAYGDAQAVALAQLKQYAQVAAVQFLPAINDVLKVVNEFAREIVGVSDATKKLNESGGLGEFAESAAKAFAFVVDQVDLITRLFLIAGKATGGYWATIAAGAQLNFTAAKNIAVETMADIDKIISQQTFGDKLAKQLSSRNASEAAAAANPASYSNEGRTRGQPTIDFDGAQKKVKDDSKQRLSDAEKIAKLVADAEESAAKDAAEAWQFYDQVMLRSSKETTDATKEMYKQWFQEIDDEQERAIEDGKAFLETKANEITEFAKAASQNVQNFLGDSLEEILDGNFDNIGDNFSKMLRKMVAQAAAAQLNKAIFGDAVGGGGTGNAGWLGDLGAWLKTLNTSSSTPMAMGTNYVPYDGFQATLHKGEAVVPKSFNPAAGGGSAARQGDVIVEDHVGVRVQRKTDDSGQLRLMISAAVGEAARQVGTGQGPMADALKSRGLSLNGNLARRA